LDWRAMIFRLVGLKLIFLVVTGPCLRWACRDGTRGGRDSSSAKAAEHGRRAVTVGWMMHTRVVFTTPDSLCRRLPPR
jgi:hypothetical protein